MKKRDLSITLNQYGTCWTWQIAKRDQRVPLLADSATVGEYAAFATASKAFQDALRVLTDIMEVPPAMPSGKSKQNT